MTIYPKKTNHVLLLSFILGLTSAISQIVFLRELITVFYGNETAYAVIFAGWLFWISVGSYATSFLTQKINNPLKIIMILQGMVYLFLPITLIALRCIKEFLHIQTGEIIGIIPMCLTSYIVLAPLTILFGGIFTLTCRLGEKEVANIYLWESIGATAGGVLFSFILVHFLSAMHILFLLSMINIFTTFFCLNRKTFFSKCALALLMVSILVLLTGAVHKLDYLTRQIQWKGFNLVTVTESIYGNITVTQAHNQYSFYENGLHSFTTNDALTSEESVHFPLLSHPQPHNVLLIGNGMGGGLREILKHPQINVDYVELDPKTIIVAQTYLPEELTHLLDDARVTVIHRDGRHVVKRSTKKYDVIIVNLSDPYTALINRYYSLEFFKEVHRILNPKGILSLSVFSSENYLNPETIAFLRSINTTLKNVFTDVQSIPGETNIFLACNANGILTLDDRVLTRRLKERHIKTQYVREYYLPFRLSDDRVSYINEVLKKDGALNTDTRPIAYLYDIVLWSTHFNITFRNFMARFQQIKVYQLMLLPILVLIIGLWSQHIIPRSPITVSIMTTGFSEIIFQLIVIIAFQTLYGYAYYKIGLIMASFMGGLCLGSLTAKKIIRTKSEHVFPVYKRIQLSICLYPLILPVVFMLFRNAPITTGPLAAVFATIFVMLPVIAGFIGGAQYPLATHFLHKDKGEEEGKTSKVAGFLYAADVLGASIGALITGTLLIPLFGINSVAILCALLNTAVFMLLLRIK